MERLAKGSGCTPLPPSHPLAPQCNDADHYPPAFWPERLEIRGQSSSGLVAPGLDLSEVLGAIGGGGGGGYVRGLRGGSEGKNLGPADAAAEGGRGRRSNLRVVVATEDPEVEALLGEYDVSFLAWCSRCRLFFFALCRGGCGRTAGPTWLLSTSTACSLLE